MANYTLKASSAFLDWTEIKGTGITASRRDELTIASVAAARGKFSLLNAAVQGAYGVALPETPQRVALGEGIQAVWAGPEQWLLVADRGTNRDLSAELAPKLRGLAAVTDQSDARAVVRVSGPRARDVLAKGLPIDLHPRAFPADGAAITHASHIGVILWQVDETPTYDLAMFRSFADSFASWLRHAAHD